MFILLEVFQEAWRWLLFGRVQPVDLRKPAVWAIAALQSPPSLTLPNFAQLPGWVAVKCPMRPLERQALFCLIHHRCTPSRGHKAVRAQSCDPFDPTQKPDRASCSWPERLHESALPRGLGCALGLHHCPHQTTVVQRAAIMANGLLTATRGTLQFRIFFLLLPSIFACPAYTT